MANTFSYVASLVCGHSVTYPPDAAPPRVMDLVLCPRCSKYQRVVPNEWSIRCQGCRLGRKFGADETNARRVAIRHAAKFHHPVSLLKGQELKETLGMPGDPLPVLVAGASQVWHTTHQAGLKDLLGKARQKQDQ